MLLSIDIRNFAIIKSLQLDWQKGMTVITGETGAGKSIVIDALGLSLGNRADQNVITPGAKQSEISALFEIDKNSRAYQWLENNNLNEEGISNDTNHNITFNNECILRRVIVREGRSKCYINGRQATQSQLKDLGRFLVDIHGQHAHQSLLKRTEQLNLLDRYANHADFVDRVKLSFQQLRVIEVKKETLEKEKQARDAKRELLTYQVDELTIANPEKSVLDNLEHEHKQAATSLDRLLLAQKAFSSLSDDESSCITMLNSSMAQLKQLASLDPTLNSLLETLSDAESILNDVSSEIDEYQAELNCDPKRLNKLDLQLSQFHDLARKHQVNLPDLPDHYANLQNQLTKLNSDDNALEEIEQEYQRSKDNYLKQSKILTKSRIQVAKRLEKLVTAKIQPLAMEGGKFAIQIQHKHDRFSANGMEEIEFMVSANPGQPLQPLSKVASGGELSRMSLAISVITSEQQLIPCIIFDEVDVGIGGATAETVGALLNQLAKKRQLICVTHQPQVASRGDQHLIASKTKTNHATTTKIIQLDPTQRIKEVARMLGGKVISEKTISHAKEMLTY